MPAGEGDHFVVGVARATVLAAVGEGRDLVGAWCQRGVLLHAVDVCAYKPFQAATPVGHAQRGVLDDIRRRVHLGGEGAKLGLGVAVADVIVRSGENISFGMLRTGSVAVPGIGAAAKAVSNRAIAAQLHISEATVKTHLVHVFAKLGVDDRTAAVTQALERGLLRH
ncbi:MAG TPA: LuxR C-terminal-related transcriptional regulator [Candidatus Limnocylindrales bacterium]